MRSLVAASLVVAPAGPASAQPPDDPPHADDKSVATAMEWSVGVTTLGVAALAGTAAMSSSTSGAKYPLFAFGTLGLLAGPSLGRIYAGHYLSGGQVVRVVGLGVMVMGEALASACLGQPRSTSCNSQTAKLDAGPILAGGAVMLLGALFDLAETPSDVERFNRESNVSLRPAPLVTASGTAPGLALSGRF